jgi:hypothetical protein
MTVFFNHAVLPEQREIEAYKIQDERVLLLGPEGCDDTAMLCLSGPHTTPGGVERPDVTPALLEGV